ncbi:MAG: PHP domain-containing protein [Oscillospiraceae bacterium]|nr:PHP domain-containing protein [Oscillospiraceae bacterium]
MIDLHIHSTYSDGTWSVNEIFTKAQKVNITALSITDHNTIEAYNEIGKKPINFAGRLISGVEIDCIANNSKIELLGYDFDDFTILDAWLKEHYSLEKNKMFRRGEYDRLLKKMQEYGIKNNCDPIYENQEYLPHTAVYREIKKFESNAAFMSEAEWNSLETFFRTATTNAKSLFYIDYTGLLPSAEEVATSLRKANGKVFLAHVYLYGVNDHIQFIDELWKNEIIDGVEVYYTKFTKEQTDTLCDYCKQNKLYMSGGSDCHGDKGNINIGIGYGNLNVPESILTEWIP